MSTYDRSTVMLSRTADASSVVLTATVTPPEAASNLRWSKTGEGFDIVPSGTSCTVNGNTSFDGYDAHGQVTAKVDTYGTIMGSQDMCDVSVVKDKGNLCDPGEFSTATTDGVTLTRTIANKYTFSGSPTYGDSPSLQVTYKIGQQSLSEGVYSLAKSDRTNVGANVTNATAQFYSPDGGNLYGTSNAALTDGQFSFNIQLTFSGGDVSGYFVPFLTKVEDSGQLLGSYNLTQDVTGWSAGDDGSSVSFSEGEAVFSAAAYNSKLSLDSEHFSHTPGTVYAAFVDIHSDNAGSIRMGDPGSPKSITITNVKKRYGILYTATTNQPISFMSDKSCTVYLSNLKLVRVTDANTFEVTNTLDEPRFESSSEFSFL